MEYKYLEDTAKQSIDEAKRVKGPIFMMVDGFITDKEALHLRDMLWYARDSGVEIVMVPKGKGGRN